MIVPVLEKKIEVLDLKFSIAMARPGQMYGWPGLTRAANGDLLLAASERKFHCCPFGREVLARSTDNGRSWTLPLEIYNSELDDRDANLLTMPDGTIVLSWFTSTAFEPYWVERGKRISPEMRRELVGAWMTTSRDNGHTWDKEPLRMPVGNHISPSVLCDGSLLTCGAFDADYCVFKSTDRGHNWQKISVIPSPVKPDGRTILNESHLLEVAPDHIVAMFRATEADIAPICQSESNDGGHTWTPIRELPVAGLPPQLLKLRNGVLMCSFGHRKSPYSIRAIFSHDLGRNWDTDNIVTLYQWDNEPDMGYPSTIELDDGELLTVFYSSWRDKAPQSKEPEGILSLRYKLRFE